MCLCISWFMCLCVNECVGVSLSEYVFVWMILSVYACVLLCSDVFDGER